MSSLPRQTLGRTGLEVTTLGYGAMELRGAPLGPAISDDPARDIVCAVLDSGINDIDTSPDYSRSEELIGRFIFDVFQIPYSVLQREHEQTIAAASAAGAGIVIRGGAARGAPTDWERRQAAMLPPGTMQDRWEQAKLDEILDGMSRMEFTLRFTLSHPDLDTTIVGTKSLDHLQDNVAAAVKGPLPADVVAEAKRRLATAGSQPVQ